MRRRLAAGPSGPRVLRSPGEGLAFSSTSQSCFASLVAREGCMVILLARVGRECSTVLSWRVVDSACCTVPLRGICLAFDPRVKHSSGSGARTLNGGCVVTVILRRQLLCCMVAERQHSLA